MHLATSLMVPVLC
uniref:Uncharacterized protein n=1 Tax=Timema monikensis TaxID=170555 RepID=A0A7R9HTF0_9NEOP|nr:unnamed protein product [Timema monikensis]